MESLISLFPLLFVAASGNTVAIIVLTFGCVLHPAEQWRRMADNEMCSEAGKEVYQLERSKGIAGNTVLQCTWAQKDKLSYPLLKKRGRESVIALQFLMAVCINFGVI